MGQKTHPTGFRIGINKKHSSAWFANYGAYSKVLEEDYKIRKFFAKISQKLVASCAKAHSSPAACVVVGRALVPREPRRLHDDDDDIHKDARSEHRHAVALIATERPHEHQVPLG